LTIVRFFGIFSEGPDASAAVPLIPGGALTIVKVKATNSIIGWTEQRFQRAKQVSSSEVTPQHTIDSNST
jgi:hypothetical protein